jgi:hypothetical protein
MNTLNNNNNNNNNMVNFICAIKNNLILYSVYLKQIKVLHERRWLEFEH